MVMEMRGDGLDGASAKGKTRAPASKTNFIRAWRLFRGIERQQDLADMTTSITRPVLSRLESGSMHYHQRHLEELAIVLRCSPGDLIKTDPNNMGDIFKIYEELRPHERDHAFKMIRELAVRRSRSRRKAKRPS